MSESNSSFVYDIQLIELIEFTLHQSTYFFVLHKFLSVERCVQDTDLRETERILSTSILRFKTSLTWPFSGPCFIFSRPMRYMHFGVRTRSRFTLWNRIIWKYTVCIYRDQCINVMMLFQKYIMYWGYTIHNDLGQGYQSLIWMRAGESDVINHSLRLHWTKVAFLPFLNLAFCPASPIKHFPFALEQTAWKSQCWGLRGIKDYFQATILDFFDTWSLLNDCRDISMTP